jgi:hypothetical protein
VEGRLVLIVNDLVGLALCESVVDVLDGLEAQLASVAGEVEVELLGLDIVGLYLWRRTKVLLR